jgi:hypothetical protein
MTTGNVTLDTVLGCVGALYILISTLGNVLPKTWGVTQVCMRIALAIRKAHVPGIPEETTKP